MNATWPVAIRRFIETIAATIPLLALLALPLLLGLRHLYPWLTPESITDSRVRSLIQGKHGYLNLPFFLARSAFSLLFWSALSIYLRRQSLRTDSADLPSLAPILKRRARAVAAALTPLFGLTLTFSSIDWIMSLTPEWSSTMFGFYWFAGAAVAGIAAVTLIVNSARRSGLLPILTASHQSALGRVLLTFTIFWAYIVFFQFLLVWIADKPDEVTYYLARARGPWPAATAILAALQFAIPFFLLLSYRLKRSLTFNWIISALILVAHYLDVHWSILPAAGAGFGFGWINLGALLFILGATVAYGVILLRGGALVARNDPAFARAVGYQSP